MIKTYYPITIKEVKRSICTRFTLSCRVDCQNCFKIIFGIFLRIILCKCILEIHNFRVIFYFRSYVLILHFISGENLESGKILFDEGIGNFGYFLWSRHQQPAQRFKRFFFVVIERNSNLGKFFGVVRCNLLRNFFNFFTETDNQYNWT